MMKRTLLTLTIVRLLWSASALAAGGITPPLGIKPNEVSVHHQNNAEVLVAEEPTGATALDPMTLDLYDGAGETAETAQIVVLSPVEGSNGAWAQAVSESIAMPGDVDFYFFVVPTAGALQVHTSGDADTWGTLYNVANTVLTVDDNSGEEVNFRIRRMIPAGIYFLAVNHVHSASVGDYDLSIEVAADPSYFDDHSNVMSQATAVELSQGVNGDIEFAGDVDLFTFHVPNSGLVSISTYGSTDTYGTLMDVDGNILAQNNDGVDRNCQFVLELAAGTYVVKIQHDTNKSSGTGPYILFVRDEK